MSIVNTDCIYVLCPPSVKTGGPELLHQLVCQLNNLGIRSHIVYWGEEAKTHPDFEKYLSTSVLRIDDIIDSPSNLLIVPESRTEYLLCFNSIQKAIWWLSVDSFLIKNSFKHRKKVYGIWNALYKKITGQIHSRMNEIKCADYHFCQSYYAIEYLKNTLHIEDNRVLYLSDYINEIYTDNYSGINTEERKNIILYNPKKGGRYTKRIRRKLTTFQWIPLQNMGNEEIRTLLSTSKMYVDFGHHPGKDRFPREAAICGCIVVTGRRGAAAYDEDIPIPDKYRFDEKTDGIDDIVNKMIFYINNYDKTINDFEYYRQFILSEKAIFINSVKNLFLQNYNDT